MNKPVCLGLSILDSSEILMYDFWYDYLKPKYGEKVKLLHCMHKQVIIIKTLRKMLKLNLTLQIMN